MKNQTDTHWQSEIPSTIQALSNSHRELLLANLALAGMTERTPGYASRVWCLDAAVLALSRGKWLYGRATGEIADFATRTSSADDLISARQLLQIAAEISKHSHRLSPRAMDLAGRLRAERLRNDTEIWHFRGTPIVPAVCPIVLLRGTSQEMGRQYARQCMQIFGLFVFETVASKPISGATRDILEAWKEQLNAHAPELIDMAKGIAEAVSDVGVAMTTDHAISMWTDLRPPAASAEPIGVLDAEGGGVMGAYFGDFESARASASEGLCSGVAAWDSASSDSHLHFAASTDHDCTFQVTIVAFPDDGHPFVYTPFSVNGSIPGIGRFGFAGHPGFNAAGLAYVHHGGGGACAEPQSEWGYGVPRGAATMHLLRFASSTREALDWELASPMGDSGRLLGHPGGFYADEIQAYVLESRDRAAPAIRRGTHGANPGGRVLRDILYATNNVQSAGLESPLFPPEEGFSWSPEEGWTPRHKNALEVSDRGLLTRRRWAHSSAGRNRYCHQQLIESNKRFDLNDLLGLFRRGPDTEGFTWPEAERQMQKGGSIKASIGHRLNAFVGAGTPSSRCYYGAVGPIAHRSTAPNLPGNGYFYHDETNTYWELSLEDNVHSTALAARSRARELVERARDSLSRVRGDHDGIARLKSLLAEAELLASQQSPDAGGGDEVIEHLAHATRQWCQAQVRARQVIEAVDPPPEWGIV